MAETGFSCDGREKYTGRAHVADKDAKESELSRGSVGSEAFLWALGASSLGESRISVEGSAKGGARPGERKASATALREMCLFFSCCMYFFAVIETRKGQCDNDDGARIGAKHHTL